MSECFRQAFLTVLSLSRPSKPGKPGPIELPIDSGQFFSEYVKKTVPEGISL